MTQMIVLNLKQGSDQWKGIRGKYLVASEAPVIMGDSPHTKRDELLHMKKTGDEKEINSWVERFVFRPGHEAEAAARPIAEDRLGEELYPITGTRVVHGLSLLASFDGMTAPAYDDSWEHKSLNAKLQAFFDSGATSESLPLMYAWQLEHQLLVAGINSCIFSASNGTEDTYHEFRYHSIPERREQLIEGWRLFMADLEAYEVREAVPEVVAAPQEHLPAVSVRLNGSIAVISNLDVFGTALTNYVDNLNLEPETDQEFADLEAACKNLKKAEDALASSEDAALSELNDVEQMRRTVAQYREVARQARLAGEKAVKAQKSNIKLKIAHEAKAQFDAHIVTLNKMLGGDWMPAIPTDFNNAMKAKRTVDSLRSAANDECARARIEANRIASRIEDNLTFFDSETEGYEFLFADKKTLVVGHDREPLQAIVKNRISEHKAKEDAKAEADRQRIREEERVKAESEAAEKVRTEKAEQDAAPETQPEPVAAQPAANTGMRSSVGVRATTPVENKTSDTEQAPLMQNAVARRPPDANIVTALCDHYNESPSTVIGWIRTMDLDATEKRLAKSA